ncbi:MAG: hypothetical protein C4527_28950 [Candidatus Omnitrophota bacterium]|jgi:hypothetical protein|nr:MAG: hypothetical protein C4527_28950 [Candidatus Omnitrophota bacterium]
MRDIPEEVNIGWLKVKLREQKEVTEEWLLCGDRVMSLLANDKKPVLLLIDEFPIMMWSILKRSHEEAEQLLRWFRTVRIAPGTKTRFVIGGSINLISTLDLHGLVDTVNDLKIIRMKSFDENTAKRFVERIFASKQMNLKPAVRKTILECVGTPIPYLLAVLLTAIFNRQRGKDRPVSVHDVKIAFEEDLLGGATSAVFRHYRSRIGDYYPDEEGRAAKSILGILSRAEQAVKKGTLYQTYLTICGLTHSENSLESFSQLMCKLENDFYIRVRDETCEFYSRVLKLWWRAKYGFQGE